MNAVRLLLLVAWSLSLCLSACGGSEPLRPRGRVTLVEPEPEDTDPFVIDRVEYVAALERGPSWFIQQVAVEPVVIDGRFRGFMVLAIFPELERSVGLVPGDIVQRVNGQRVERPDQFMRVWQGLAERDQLTVRVVRGRRPLLLTWAIR